MEACPVLIPQRPPLPVWCRIPEGCWFHQSRNGKMISLQVLDDIDTKERETRAFAKLNNFIPGSKCIIITNSEETNFEYDGIDIEVIPIWKWLLMADL